MGRRLFDRLQQRVERTGRKLVHLVDDEHLVAVTHRCDREPRDDDLAHVLDLRMRGGVDFQHIDVAPRGDLQTRVALAAGVGGRSGHTVQCARQDTGGGRLAHPARAGEHERLGEPVHGDGVAQGLSDTPLPHHVIEPLRAPLARDYLIGHGMNALPDHARRTRHVASGRRVPAATRKSLRHMSVTT